MKNKNNSVEVSQGELICCPLPGQTSWNQHPRVYIDLNNKKENSCHYCGRHFVVVDYKSSAEITND